MATIERNDSNGWFKYTLDVWESNVETGNNRSKVNWTFKITRLNKYHKWKYSRNVVWWSLNIAGNSYSGGIPEFGVNNTSETVRTLSSSSVWVGHNSDGSKSVSFSFSANSEYPSINYLPGPASNSGSMTLTRIARQANITDASNFNDEQNPTVYYSNPAGTAVTVDTCISWTGSADIGYRGVDENKSSYTYSLSSSERTTLRKACATANSKTVTFYIRTYVGGEYKYSTLNRTLTIVNATPTISPTIKDTNETTVALTGDNQKFIKGYSNAAVTIGSSAKKEAWISSNSMSNSGRTLSSNGTFNNITSGSFSFWTKDSRGNTASKTVNKTVIDYIPLTCGIEAQPPTTDGKLTIHIKGNYFNNTFGTVANTLTLQYRSKTNSGEYGAWETITPTLNGNTYEFTKELTGLDYKSVYTFQAQAVDKLRTITTPEKALKSLPVFDWGEHDFRFNVPVTGPNLQTIHSSGVDNGWEWVKYTDGSSRATCIVTTTPVTHAWGNGFLTPTTEKQNYPPNVFITTPHEYGVHEDMTSSAGWATGFVTQYSGKSSTYSCSYCLGRFASANFTGTISFRIIAEGRWK